MKTSTTNDPGAFRMPGWCQVPAAGAKWPRRAAGWMLVLVLAVWAATDARAGDAPVGMTLIPAGVYHPLFHGKLDPVEIGVKRFYLAEEPVSNAEFLAFVRANPRWQRSNVSPLFADKMYLAKWAGDLQLGSNAPAQAPVTCVSWFAARAYAEWKGWRLPTLAEWEYAAAASASRPDGENDPKFQAQVLAWYAESNPTENRSMGGGQGNYYGVRDLHGLIWEWVADFNSALFSGDAADGGVDGRLFCGAGAQSSQDVADYPAFMRYAFRSSLKASYCIHNLGFRCAKDY